ncbi:unnamed protein product [Soboliphyme baturini]|uniref:AAA_34 domain-containing protein n=1 Tax=Soboliphyme baturini TaxID=241478 RepID=A0A183ICD8_9BILA|nr:unnamed protein product [Soboliphyme baturini]
MVSTARPSLLNRNRFGISGHDVNAPSACEATSVGFVPLLVTRCSVQKRSIGRNASSARASICYAYPSSEEDILSSALTAAGLHECVNVSQASSSLAAPANSGLSEKQSMAPLRSSSRNGACPLLTPAVSPCSVAEPVPGTSSASPSVVQRNVISDISAPLSAGKLMKVIDSTGKVCLAFTSRSSSGLKPVRIILKKDFSGVIPRKGVSAAGPVTGNGFDAVRLPVAGVIRPLSRTMARGLTFAAKDSFHGNALVATRVNAPRLHSYTQSIQRRQHLPKVPVVTSTTTVASSGAPYVMTPFLGAAAKQGFKYGYSNFNDGSSFDRNGVLGFDASTETSNSEEAEEDYELGHADTYSEYAPSKPIVRSGLSHPDSVVETSSLASVQPPDITYHAVIPEEVIDTGRLSALQLETIIYACQQHETFLLNGERTGYLIGDGPGVGKGRTIAGIIYENYLLGRKRSLWFSVSGDLKYDAERDLADIGASRIKVHALNKFKYSKISGKENGSVKKGVIFATYASLIGETQNAKQKYHSRVKQLLHWCGSNFDGVVVFDECHRAKNLVPTGSSKSTKTGLTVLELQKALPKARIIYASATGATEPRHMAYMARLGLWGSGKPFRDFNEFITAVERRGVGAMEIIAMDMKLRGLYLARQLSFNGVTFRVEEVPLSVDFIRTYDKSVKLWLEARKQFQIAADLIDLDKSRRKAMWGQFWAAHQRFFKYLCIAAKCIVIGLQSTGEARTLEQLDEYGGELTDFVSTAKGVFQSLVEKHFPAIDSSSKYKYTVRKTLFDQNDVDESLRNAGTDSVSSWKKNCISSFVVTRFLSACCFCIVSLRKRERQRPRVEQPDGERLSDDQSDSSSVKRSSDHSSSSSSDSEESESSEGSSGERDSSDAEEADSSDSEALNDSLNPFADDFSGDSADPWEEKMKTCKRQKKVRRKSRKRRKIESSNEEETANVENENDDTKATAEDDVVRTPSDLFNSTEFAPGRLATELGLNQAQVLKADLLAAIERLGDVLPPNTLDELINELGGPEYVAEMTGRKGRVVSKDDGQVQYELRNDGDVPLEMLNMAEKERFMNGTKRIAIISEAASSGISLQSDRRAKNQRRRVHITLELPWSADKAIQQFGRTHRSNQVNSPEYIFLISELAGEQRFASVVAKRLESLGALTHGDRRATESRDLSQFNVDTKYGRVALDVALKSVISYMSPIVQPPSGYEGDFFEDMKQYLEGIGLVVREGVTGAVSLEKDLNTFKFLNRILGLPVKTQNCLFQYFSDTLKEIIEQAKRDGRYDLGILDLGQKNDKVKKLETKVFVGQFQLGGLKTELHTVCVERGMPWSEAMEVYCEHMGEDDGFYACGNEKKTFIALVCAINKRHIDTGEKLFNLYRPNTGLNSRVETLSHIKQRYKKIMPEKAEAPWKELFAASSNQCQHMYWYGRCHTTAAGQICDFGRRRRNYYILSGSVMAVWNLVENMLSSLPGRRQARMQIVRVRAEQGQKIVGILIPSLCVQTLIQRLTAESSRVYVLCPKK